MNESNEIVDDLFEQIDQEFNDQEFYGLQYVVDELFPDGVAQPHEELATDWYGLSDLSI